MDGERLTNGFPSVFSALLILSSNHGNQSFRAEDYLQPMDSVSTTVPHSNPVAYLVFTQVFEQLEKSFPCLPISPDDLRYVIRTILIDGPAYA